MRYLGRLLGSPSCAGVASRFRRGIAGCLRLPVAARRATQQRGGFRGRRAAVRRAATVALFWTSLLSCLLLPHRAPAFEVFADFLYWRATEPVDWVLDTNRQPTNQFVAYETIDFDLAPGFRAGIELDETWGTRLYYTRFHTTTEDSASGNLTPAFLGGKLALSDAPASTPPYFDEGRVQAVIDYNVLDCDFGRRFHPLPSLQLRPVLGIRGAWINQQFDSEFQDLSVSKRISEHMENNFWGIGPKLGIENAWNVRRGEAFRVDLMANFYTAYLLGHWAVQDATRLTASHHSQTIRSERVIPIRDRDFGALTFQVLVGVRLEYGRWSAMAGYEINDWLNQCQIFDDATGPHNNDLLLQGLTASVRCRF